MVLSPVFWPRRWPRTRDREGATSLIGEANPDGADILVGRVEAMKEFEGGVRGDEDEEDEVCVRSESDSRIRSAQG